MIVSAPHAPRNRLIKGIGNGVMKIAFGSVAVHARIDGIKIVARTVSPQELLAEDTKIESLKRRFIIPDEEDAHSLIVADMIKRAEATVHADHTNIEAALERETREVVDMLQKEVEKCGQRYDALQAQVLAVSHSLKNMNSEGEIEQCYAQLRDFDRDIEQSQKTRDTWQRNINDNKAIMEAMVRFLYICQQGSESGLSFIGGIHVADSFTWPEMQHMVREQRAEGFVCSSDHFGPINHNLIFSHKNGVPMVVVAAPLQKIDHTNVVTIDSRTGEVIVNPDDETTKHLMRTAKKYKERQALYKKFAGTKVSLDGQPLPALQRNIEDENFEAKEIEIGLFRSEGLYVQVRPAVQQLVRSLKKIFQKAKIVNFRLFDVSTDKLPKWFTPADIEEVKKGKRGINYLLNTETGKSILYDQIKSLLIAYYRSGEAMKGKTVRLLIPMITNAEEIQAVKQKIRDIEDELKAKNLITKSLAVRVGDQIEIASMIETEEAVNNLEAIIAESKYLSIGGNDLACDLLEIEDRKLLMTSKEKDWLAPKVLANILRIVRIAKEKGIPVGFCGEMARDPIASILLTLKGVGSLSMDETYCEEINYNLGHIYYDEWIKFSRKDKNGKSAIDKVLEKLGYQASKDEGETVVGTVLKLKDALEVRRFICELIMNHSHSNTKIPLEDEFASYVPLTYLTS